ncbi:MAG: lamin tail domain-containing protein, partial [Planctomycetota bacterium]
MKGLIFINLIAIVGMFTLASNPAAAQLVINEIMKFPAAVNDQNGEWFEIYNPTAGDVDIDGWTIKDNDYDIHVINNGGPLIVSAGGFLVLGRNGDSGANGGVTVDYEYTNIKLHTVDDELVLLNEVQDEVDRVEWYDGSNFPNSQGAAMALMHPALDNNIGTNWCEASTSYGDGDLGTPGSANDCNFSDTTPPEITCPADLQIECGEPTEPDATGSATATDNIDPNPSITFSDIITPDTCPNKSQITRTWTATDAVGNSSSCDQVITVLDTTPPVLSGVPEDLTIECDLAVPDAADVTASDNCDEAVTVQFNEVTIEGDCPSNYVIERTWTATDSCSNEVSATQTITVQDTTGPAIELIGDEIITLECHDTYEELGATASDNCDTEPIDVVIDGDMVDTAPGVYVVTYDAIDACGNAAEQVERIVNVVDITPPVVTVGDMIEIWPPNHKYREFNLSDLVLSAEDGCEGTLDVDIAGTIISISSDELEEAKSGGDGKTFNDMVILNSSSFKVRAERLGNGNGRVYTITFEVADASGNKIEET